MYVRQSGVIEAKHFPGDYMRGTRESSEESIISILSDRRDQPRWTLDRGGDRGTAKHIRDCALTQPTTEGRRFFEIHTPPCAALRNDDDVQGFPADFSGSIIGPQD